MRGKIGRLHAAGLRAFLTLILTAALSTGAGCAGAGVTSVNTNGGVNDALAVNPLNSGEGYSVVLYDNTNGLPTSEANAVAQTAEGFIWIGSYSGLIRYDGTHFERVEGSSVLASVECLYVDSRGWLWIGTNDSGVALLRDGQMTVWNRKDGFPGSSVKALAEDGGGNVYIGTTAGLMMFDSQLNLSRVEDERLSDAYIHHMRVGNDGVIYGIAEIGEVFTLRDGRVQRFYDKGELLKSASAILPDPENPGYVYIETEDSYVFHGNMEADLQEGEFHDLYPLTYAQQMEYIDGKLWICGRNGLGVLEEDGFVMLKDIPMNNSLTNLMTDYEGNMWVTSSRQGLMKIVPNRFTDMFDRFGIEEAVVNTTCLRDGVLFVGTDTGLVAMNQKNRVNRIPLTRARTAGGYDLGTKDLIELLDGCRIRSIIRDSHNRLWISTWRKFGLLCYTDGQLIAYTEDDGMLSDVLRSVWEMEDESILTVGNGGVCVIRGGAVVESYGPEDGITNTELLTVAANRKGDILLGSNGGGIYVITGEGTRHITLDDGLTSEVVMRLKPDPKRGICWFVTSNSIGYLTADYEVVTIEDFPYSNNYDMYENSRGEMWIIASDGIYVVETDQLIRNEKIDYVHFDMSDGMPGVATGNSYSELTSGGELYIASTSGVIRVNIDEELDDVTLIKAAVPYIDADGARLYPEEDGQFHVKAGVKKLTIYGFVFSNALNDPQVSYRLEGFDDADVSVSSENLQPVDYTNLPGGTYRFVMRLKDSVSLGDKTISVTIVKDRAIYERPLFYVFLALVAGTLILLVFRQYVHDRMHVLERKHQEQAEKERLVTELDMARNIQGALLPTDFAALAESGQIDIFATMDPAREVGGDFYDFFHIDEDHLCLVMADVSGKGVPAALFMAISKVMLKDSAQLGQSAADILRRTNEAVCAENKTGMFVTVWIGILELSTGKLTCANAGHEYPALMREGRFDLVKDRHGLVIGGMSGVRYREYELQLEPGDKLFVYTDGVPEAINEKNEPTSRCSERRAWWMP